MKIKFLRFLCDPIDHTELILQNEILDGDKIVSGILRSKNFSYSIIDGIPNFISNKNYSESFGFQWKRWSKTQFSEQNSGLLQFHTKKMFDDITGFTKKDLKKKVVLDAGCGAGRFTEVCLKMNATVIAIDASEAINVAKVNLKNRDSNLFLIKADVLKLPLKTGVIDYSFSIGVLHHTPFPLRGVKEAFRTLKKKENLLLGSTQKIVIILILW